MCFHRKHFSCIQMTDWRSVNNWCFYFYFFADSKSDLEITMELLLPLIVTF